MLTASGFNSAYLDTKCGLELIHRDKTEGVKLE
jgi:hypothetical protein